MRLKYIEGIVGGVVGVERVAGAIAIRFIVAYAIKDLVIKQFISIFLLYSKSSLIYTIGERYYSNNSSNNF